MSPIPDAQAGPVEPKPSKATKICAGCGHRRWHGWNVFCEERFEMMAPGNPACAEWVEIDHKTRRD